MRVRRRSPLIAALLSIAPFSAGAFDFSYSGYGTLGYATSDRSYTYQRFIDDRGTFKRDSVAGLQLDLKLADQFGATVQAKLAPASSSDSQYEATISWAFLTYRPTNDWLFRIGKQRIPLYLFSENYDVGTTYDFARLPTEMYSLAPSNDFTGFSFSKNWTTQAGDVILDGYWGKSTNDFRFWFRDAISPVQSSGALFRTLDFSGGGLILAFKARNQMFRVALHRAAIRLNDKQPVTTNFPFVAIAPGVGYYQVDPSLPGPGVSSTDIVTNTTLTAGAEFGLPADFRVVTEFALSKVPKSDFAPQGTRGYASLLRQFGHWTPYATYAFMRSPSNTVNLYKQVNYNRVPDTIPGAALINASQRAGAEQIITFDQHSWALGTSYSFSATSKLKAEFLRTHVGNVSNLVDAPPRSDIRNQDINVLSFSYSFVF